MGYWWYDGTNLVNLKTGETRLAFIPGVTRPVYEITQDFTGAKNVGAFGNLTPYTGSVVDGVATLHGDYYENTLFECVVDLRHAQARLKNCMIVVPETYTRTDDSIKACVRSLNGSVADVVLEDVEIHNRAQRPMNGIMGKNVTMRRSVITGCIDGWRDSNGGGAPNLFGFVVEDSICPALAVWYSDVQNPDIHLSDKGSHSDVIQKVTPLQATFSNTVLLAYVDDIIGMGTPGSGNDAGNPYVPTGHNYVASQAQGEAWREQYTMLTTPSQTYTGRAERIMTGVGSMAAVMVNDPQLDLHKCVLAGGTVGINAVDQSFPHNPIDMSLTDNEFWNDMANGHGGNPATKGHAILTQAASTFEVFTNNRWAAPLGGGLINKVIEGSYGVWK